VGAELLLAAVIENAGSEADDLPSLTEITIPGHVLAEVGLPVSEPVELENCAQDGRLTIENRNLRAGVSGSFAVGVKEYELPTMTVCGGEPEIVGGTANAAIGKKTAASAAMLAKDLQPIPREMHMTTLSRHRHRDPTTDTKLKIE
jgi:hypothetical protein